MNRLRIALCAGLSLSSFFCLIPDSFGQSLFEKAPDEGVEFHLTPKNQLIRVFFGNRSRLAGSSDLALFLANEKVANELDFNSAQTSELNRLIKESSKLRAKILKESEGNPYTAKVKGKEWLAKYIEDEKQMDAKLLDHQKERFKQIYRRWSFRKISLPMFLLNEFKKADLSLDGSQKKQLKQLSAEHEKKVTSKLKDMRDKYVALLRKQLTDKQKEELARKIPEQFQSDFVCLSLTAVRLSDVKDELEDNGDVYWNPIGKQDSYLLEPDGSLSVNPRVQPRSAVAANYLFMNASGPFFEDMLLTEEQVLQLRKSSSDFVKFTLSYSKNRPAKFNQDPVKYYEEQKRHREETYEKERVKILTQFRESLTQPQVAAMKRLFGQVQCSNLGLVRWILSKNGLRDDLNVGDTQKNKIIKALKKLVGELNGEVAKLEADYERAIKPILDADQRKLMTQLIGQPIKNSASGPELFLQRLQTTQYLILR